MVSGPLPSVSAHLSPRPHLVARFWPQTCPHKMIKMIETQLTCQFYWVSSFFGRINTHTCTKESFTTLHKGFSYKMISDDFYHVMIIKLNYLQERKKEREICWDPSFLFINLWFMKKIRVVTWVLKLILIIHSYFVLTVTMSIVFLKLWKKFMFLRCASGGLDGFWRVHWF